MKKILRLKDKKVRAHYYHDGSGEIEVISYNKWGVNAPYVFYQDNDKMVHHIKSLEDKIAEYATDLATLKRAHKLLKKNLKNLKTLQVPNEG
jgi:hypothetical protein